MLRLKLNVKVFVLLGSMLISGCANYTPATAYSSQGPQKSTADNGNLIVPEGLSEPDINSKYKLANQPQSTPTYLINNIKDMKIEQGGSERWLVVKNKNVNDVWPMMVDFLNQQGLALKYQNKAVGVLQTDWATRNNNVSQTGIRAFFEYVGWGSMYAMPTQYMFRVTMWQNESNTQIFVTDIQMSEVYPGCKSSLNSTVEISSNQITRWMAMPPNPQLELEFLMQFMAFSGLTPEQVKQVKNEVILESQVAIKQAQIKQNTVIINDQFDRAWWRTGLALDRVGLGVADKNRTTGTYYVYSLQSQANMPEQWFFSKLFGTGAGTNLKMPEAQYTVILQTNGAKTILSMKPIEANPDKKITAAITKYVNDLAGQLY